MNRHVEWAKAVPGTSRPNSNKTDIYPVTVVFVHLKSNEADKPRSEEHCYARQKNPLLFLFILSIYNLKDSSPIQNILLFESQYPRRFHPGKHVAIIHLHYLFWVCILGILTLLENNYFCPKIRIVFVLFFHVAMTAHLYFIYPFVFDMCSSVHLLRFSFVLQILSCAQLIPSWMKSRSRIHKRRKKKTKGYKN